MCSFHIRELILTDSDSTAFDILGLGVANATSRKAAIQLAAELVNQSSNHRHD
jgi:4-hydroxy-L-threonine phosphate dehydrogenase PdxA